MEFKELDLLSEKVAKALYLIKNLQSEKESLLKRVDSLSAENEKLKGLLGAKEEKISAASKRLEGMLDSLRILDGGAAASQGDLFGVADESEPDEDVAEEELLAEENLEPDFENSESVEAQESEEEFSYEENGDSQDELPY